MNSRAEIEDAQLEIALRALKTKHPGDWSAKKESAFLSVCHGLGMRTGADIEKNGSRVVKLMEDFKK